MPKTHTSSNQIKFYCGREMDEVSPLANEVLTNDSYWKRENKVECQRLYIGRINWPSSFKKSNTSISYTDIFPNSLYIFTSIFH